MTCFGVPCFCEAEIIPFVPDTATGTGTCPGNAGKGNPKAAVLLSVLIPTQRGDTVQNIT
jgi:hypothetical protein